jgi:2-phosphosulfolactate phosphatase
MACNPEVLFAPAEFRALPQRDLCATVCVVFDVLRATSSFVTALANGAAAVVPVEEISEALALRRRRPEVLLAGERNGLRIGANQTGGIEFDFGNSPREYVPGKVGGKTIVSTTTNGTRALRACAGARQVLVGSFLNLGATVRHVQALGPEALLLVCGGTFEDCALEDVLAAGAFCDALGQNHASRETDSAHIARTQYLAVSNDLLGAMQHSRNARRLVSVAELREDVSFCLRRDVYDLAAGVELSGEIRKITLS